MKKRGLEPVAGGDGKIAAVPHGLDHLIYAAADLHRGMDEIEHMLGLRPTLGGRHPDYGTCNALLNLGPSCYLEVIAPDPASRRADHPPRSMIFGLDTLQRSRLVSWVLRCEFIDVLASRARAAGLDLGAVVRGVRENPDGRVMSWKLTDPNAARLGGVVPFLIAWGDTPHPARRGGSAGSIIGLRVEHPDPAAVRHALNALGVELDVVGKPAPALVATIRIGSRCVELKEAPLRP